MSEVKEVARANKYEEWRVRDALETICRAKKFMKDKKMMRLVREMARRQLQDLKSIGKLQ